MGDGSPALAAMLASKPCIAVALTQEHADGVKSHLANIVFKGYYSEGSGGVAAAGCPPRRELRIRLPA